MVYMTIGLSSNSRKTPSHLQSTFSLCLPGPGSHHVHLDHWCLLGLSTARLSIPTDTQLLKDSFYRAALIT